MASTTFVDSQTPVVAAWLNDVNDYVYSGIPPSGSRPRGTVTSTAGQTVFTVPFTDCTRHLIVTSIFNAIFASDSRNNKIACFVTIF